MTKNKAPTLRQFQDRFPTEESCLEHLMRIRYGDRHDCESCGKSAHFYRVKARRSYACEYCGHQVYPTAGTPFEKTRTPLRDWFHVMFMFTTSRNGVAAKEVERQLGVTYKTAWRMCHEIRKYMGALDGDDPVGGFGSTVEIDETFIGGKVKGKGHGYIGNKTVVFGALAKGGDVVTRIIPDRRTKTLIPVVRETVLPHSTVHSDELSSYMTVRGYNRYRHLTVNHVAGEYVSRDTGATVNGIEGFWAQLKRGINGTHIHVSAKHLSKYLGEFEFRHNRRHVAYSMLGEMMTGFRR